MSAVAEEMIQAFRSAAERYAQAKAKAVYLDHYRGVVLARMMEEAAQEGITSLGAQERHGKASDQYLLHLHGHRAAVEQELLCKADMQAREYEIECWRTMKADERAERKAYAA